jgi:WS/DGAT/MGAT family acyltransferase
MLAAILDPSPDVEPTEPGHWTPDSPPTTPEMLWLTVRQLVRNPERFIRISVRAMRELGESTRNGGIKTMAEIMAQPLPGPLGDVIRQRLRGDGGEVDEPPPLPARPAPRTPFNASITPHRRFAYTTVPLEDAKVIRRAFGCTFNDVVMALCASTLRRYLIEQAALPAEPLIAAVPVSVRTGNEEDMYQNRVSMILGDLATDEPDAVARLRRVQRSMDRAKSQFAALPADALQDFSQFAPPALSARAMRLYSRLKIADRMNPPFNLIISNVPGPREPLYSSGARLEHFYPISAVVDGQGLNMTVQSYVGNLDFGFVSDRDLIPDLWRLVDLLQESMAEYLAAARAELGSEAEPAPATPPAPARRRKAAARKATKRSPATKRTAKTTAKKATARKTTARKTAATSAGRKAPAASRAATKRSATKKRASAPS